MFEDLSNDGIKAEVVDKNDAADVKNVVEGVIETIVDDVEAAAVASVDKETVSMNKSALRIF